MIVKDCSNKLTEKDNQVKLIIRIRDSNFLVSFSEQYYCQVTEGGGGSKDMSCQTIEDAETETNLDPANIKVLSMLIINDKWSNILIKKIFFRFM